MNKKFIPGLVVAIVAVGFAIFVAAYNVTNNSTDKQVKGASTAQATKKSDATTSTEPKAADENTSTAANGTGDTTDQGGVPADQKSNNVLAAITKPVATPAPAPAPADTSASSSTGSSTDTGSTATTGTTTGTTTTATTTPTTPSTDCTAAARVENKKPLASGFTGGLVSLTFDDGLTSTYTNGLPLLHKYCLVSTQFMISDTLQNNASYLNASGTNDYMTVDNAKQFLNAQNGVEGTEIGDHTVHHCDLANNQYTQTDDATACPIPLSAAQVNSELVDSKAYLESTFGTTITDFASPYGNYDENTLAAIKAAGFSSHRSTDGGFNVYGSVDLDDVWVQNVESTTTVAQVEAWVNEAVTNNEWLVLVYHDVADTSDPAQAAGTYGITKANLDSELAYISQSGIRVATMAEAVAASGAPALNGQWDYAQYYAGLTFPADKSQATAGTRPATTTATTPTPTAAADTTTSDTTAADTTTTPATDQPATDSTDTAPTDQTPPTTETVPGANTQSNAFGL